MASSTEATDAFATDDRDQFIPIRKTELVQALLSDCLIRAPALHEQFQQLCRLLSAIFHYEYFEALEKLRDDYHYFNPDLDSNTEANSPDLATARAEFLETLDQVLKGANYKEISLEEIEKAHSDRPSLRVKVKATTENYHKVSFFRRGHRIEEVKHSRWAGLRTRIVRTRVFDNVIMMVTVKLPGELQSKRQAKALQVNQLRPGTILIKYFRQIALSDLHMLLPRVRVVMGTYDKMTIAVPALAGGIPLLLNAMPTLTVLFLVAGFYLGLTGPVEHEQVVKALAALSGVSALAGLVMRQRLKYERLSLKYQKQISDHCYYRNVSNNIGIFDFVVGAAEEQECKEAFLAYYFLMTSNGRVAQEEIDRRIEAWLQEKFKLDIDFEVDDALAKLDRLGLLLRDGNDLSVLPPDRALFVLDQRWDNFFPFANELEIGQQAVMNA
ncbi:DUF3754 domain-containing protein [Hyphomicrobium sp.]|uniref:DUF3754 domain-containing protein n=1 Tax=Hyphomicrobium sp. TaxID=82 RepID=UPI0025BC23F4|nr:DUF3754 domain-containing protein [Hyphomicrobium sp.]